MVDEAADADAVRIANLLQPWNAWLEVAEIVETSTAGVERFVASLAGVDALAIVSEQAGFVIAARNSAHKAGIPTSSSGYETDSARSQAFMQEMAHHHYEIGGRPEWDGATLKHSAAVLQHLSAANSVSHFPVYVHDELRRRSAELGRPLDALDIGSGPISRLRWGAIQGFLSIAGVDPLHDLYDIVLHWHGLDAVPAIRVDRSIAAAAEQLDEHVEAASYDFAYCCNALDHVEDPPRVVAQIGRALRPGARCVLEFATREGSRQQWQQLHQFDLYYDEPKGALMCQSQDGTLRTLLSEPAGLELAGVVLASPDYTAVVLNRHGLPTSHPAPQVPRLARERSDDKPTQATGFAEQVSDPVNRFPIGFYYSPMYDTRELGARRDALWPSSPRTTVGIDWRGDEQLGLCRNVFARQHPMTFPDEPSTDPTEYFASNGQYPPLDAWILASMLEHIRPGRMVEIGSGFSTLVSARVNRERLGRKMVLTCIEPYPRDFLTAGIDGVAQLRTEKVQDTPLAVFTELEAGDVLFIDTSHTVKTGGDVVWIFHEILPRLAPGVFVHVHDIFLPGEYPEQWVMEGWGWNETYLVQSFLSFNSEFRVILGTQYMLHFHLDELFAAFPDLHRHEPSGAALWMERRTK